MLGGAEYKDGVVKFKNGSFDPKGFVGVKKEDFVEQWGGRLQSDISEVWSLIVKHRPKATKKSKSED